MIAKTLSHETWLLGDAVEQLRKCDYECEGGPLKNNAAFQWLSSYASMDSCPKFMPGQGVWFLVEATAGGSKLTQWVGYYIVGMRMASDCDRRYWEYDLSYDPPGPYHYGETHFHHVHQDKLRLTKPDPASAPTVISGDVE